MGTEGPFPGNKARPGRDADHSPPFSAEVVNEYELYLLTPKRLHGVYWDCFTFFSLLSLKENRGFEITIISACLSIALPICV
jgi:hypothetical protein